MYVYLVITASVILFLVIELFVQLVKLLLVLVSQYLVLLINPFVQAFADAGTVFIARIE